MNLKRSLAGLAVFATSVMGCARGADTSEAETMDAFDGELIVLAAPVSGDPYYREVNNAIFDFHVAYAEQIEGPDRVLILADQGSYGRYITALGSERVAAAPMFDIWTRDFAPSNAARPLMFRYTSEGQAGAGGQRSADEVQERLSEFLVDAGLRFEESDLKNDGGNFVDDYAGRVVLSRKFLRDNGLTESEGRSVLREIAGVDHVAFIDADEQGGLEHADGVVAFVEANTLIINSYPEDPAYARQLRSDLEAGLPDVVIHEVVTPYDGSNVYDDRFGSACGLYTNALVTPARIYLPQFGIPEDSVALEQVRAATSREVIPVRSEGVCPMGGGVRCMSWQLRGENARALLEYFGKPID